MTTEFIRTITRPGADLDLSFNSSTKRLLYKGREFGASSDAVDARDFNIDFTGANASTSELQSAVEQSMDDSKALILPAGVIAIDDTIECRTSGGASLQSVTIIGQGMGKPEDATPKNRTLIDATSVLTRPGISLSGMASAHLEGFAIEGPWNDLSSEVIADYQYDNSVFDLPAGVRDSANSPQCGIGIDVFSGTSPGDGGYPSHAYTSIGGSKKISIVDVQTFKHVVGIMHNPGNATNGEDMSYTRCRIQDCLVGWASGQAQANAQTFFHPSIERCRTAFDCLEYGDEQGDAPLVFGGHFGFLFELVAASFEGATFIGGFAENIHRLGEQQSGNSRGPTTFLNFQSQLSVDSVRSPIIFESNDSTTIFKGCNFSNTDKAFNIVCDDGRIEDTTIEVDDVDRPVIAEVSDYQKTASLARVRVVQGGNNEHISREGFPFTLPERINGHYAARHVNGREGVYTYVPRQANNYILVAVSGGAGSRYTFNSGDIEFDVSATTDIQVGDIMHWRMEGIGKSSVTRIVPALEITAIATLTVTASHIFPAEYYDETWDIANARIQVTRWAPGQVITGDLNSSTSITNLNAAGQAAIQNGDFIGASSGLHANTRVVSGAGTSTLTLNRAATETTATKTLFHDRLYDHTGTAAF